MMEKPLDEIVPRVRPMDGLEVGMLVQVPATRGTAGTSLGRVVGSHPSKSLVAVTIVASHDLRDTRLGSELYFPRSCIEELT